MPRIKIARLSVPSVKSASKKERVPSPQQANQRKALDISKSQMEVKPRRTPESAAWGKKAELTCQVDRAAMSWSKFSVDSVSVVQPRYWDHPTCPSNLE